METATNFTVTVLNDGLPVNDNITITITLQYPGVGSDDIFLDTAELVIRPPGINIC